MSGQEEYNLDINTLLSDNIANILNEDQLDDLGAELLEQVNTDIDSRKEWLEKNDKWMELVTQVMEKKTFPWPDASNIKFPLVATAAVQFHARAFPALLGNTTPVRAKTFGRDPRGVKAERAVRVETYMSHQVLHEMEEWVDDMDRALVIVPIIGSVYKKTYYSPTQRQNVSELIHPRDLIINYDARDVKSARKTHRLWKLPNEIKELQNREFYRKFEGDDIFLPTQQQSEVRDKTQGLNNPGKEDTHALQELFEVHCLLDLDGDGYKEPYVATLRASDGKVFRLIANYTEASIESDEEKILAITAKDYFTHFFFLPDPESKTHGIGLGTMVGPINVGVNTILNQLTDAGTLSNMQGGFLSRGVRIKGGAVKFNPGEWKTINATGDDLRKGIFPMPVREPSHVLFQLLGLLIDSGKDLSSVQDMMVGRNPGQNQPYSTSQMVIEQGMKVFNGIYKRLYRSMTAEFKKLYKLNGEFLDIKKYRDLLDVDGMDVTQAEQAFGKDGVIQFLSKDFSSDDMDIIPTAEPDMIAEMQKIMRANSLLEKVGMGLPLNKQEVTKRVLEAEGHEGVPNLMNVPPPQPPADVVLKMQEFQHKKQMDILAAQLNDLKTKSEVLNLNIDSELKLAQANNENVKGVHDRYMQQQKALKEEFDAVTKRMKVIADARQTNETGEQSTGAPEQGNA